MIRWMLDANVLIALVAGRSEALMRRVEATEPGSLAVSSIVVHELTYGACRSQRIAHNLETLRLLLADLALLEFGREEARAAGEIRAGLARRGTPIGPYDVLIAGHALARRLPLASCDEQHRGVQPRGRPAPRRLDPDLNFVRSHVFPARS